MISPLRPIAAASMLLLACTAPAAPRQTPQQRLDRILAGRTAGKEVDCLPSLRDDNRSEVIDGLGVTYSRGRTLYLNRLGGTCGQLGNDTILVTRSYGQMCRGDPVQLLSRTIRSTVGSCVLGAFQPYTRAP